MLQILRDKRTFRPQRIISTMTNLEPEKPYEVDMRSDQSKESMEEYFKKESAERMQSTKNKKKGNIEELRYTTECDYSQAKFNSYYWKYIHPVKIIKAYKIEYTHYNIPKTTFRRHIENVNCRALVLATYHHPNCNFMHIDEHKICTCKGEQQDLCTCIWDKYGDPAVKKIHEEQEHLFNYLKEKISKNKVSRKSIMLFAQNHLYIMKKNIPKEIDPDLWNDFVVPIQLSKFRKLHLHSLAMLGLEIHYTTHNREIWLDENANTYRGADKKYFNKIKRDPSKMTKEDRAYRFWMTTYTKKTSDGKTRFHLTRSQDNQYKIWKLSPN